MSTQAWISSKQETEAEEQKQNPQNAEREDSFLGGDRDSVKTTELIGIILKDVFCFVFKFQAPNTSCISKTRDYD